MKKMILGLLLTALIFASNVTPSFAKEEWDDRVTMKTIGAGALSLIVWPGIGQAMNNNKGEKILTHAVLFGLFPPGRFWSCYDAVIDRDRGYWKGRI